MSRTKSAPELRKTGTRRPGGRTHDVTQRVFATAMELLEEGGASAVTFQKIARRAEVGRATLYRRWPEPAFLIADALAATAADQIRIKDTGSLRGDLAAMMTQIARFVDSSTGRAAIIAGLSGREQPEFARMAAQLWQRRAENCQKIVTKTSCSRLLLVRSMLAQSSWRGQSTRNGSTKFSIGSSARSEIRTRPFASSATEWKLAGLTDPSWAEFGRSVLGDRRLECRHWART